MVRGLRVVPTVSVQLLRGREGLSSVTWRSWTRWPLWEGVWQFLATRSNPQTSFVWPDSLFKKITFKNKVLVFKNWEFSHTYPDFWLFSKSWTIWDMGHTPHGSNQCPHASAETYPSLQIVSQPLILWGSSLRSLLKHVKRGSALINMRLTDQT